MSDLDKVTALLKRLVPAAICDDCIAPRLKFSHRQQANQTTTKLERLNGFDRRKGYCKWCGGTKKVIKYVAGKTQVINTTATIKKAKQVQRSASRTTQTASQPALSDIIDIGFRPIGHWYEERGKLKFNQRKMQENSPAMYSFVAGERVMYVGETSQTLAKRLYFYANPGLTQSTNIRLNAILLRSLLEGSPVEIFGYYCVVPTKVGIFDLDMAAGLEDAIIQKLQPHWNKRK